MNRNKKFKVVYYIIQTAPIFKVCGHVFNIDSALFVAKHVTQKTNSEAKIIRFTRAELEGLQLHDKKLRKNKKR